MKVTVTTVNVDELQRLALLNLTKLWSHAHGPQWAHVSHFCWGCAFLSLDGDSFDQWSFLMQLAEWRQHIDIEERFDQIAARSHH